MKQVDYFWDIMFLKLATVCLQGSITGLIFKANYIILKSAQLNLALLQHTVF